MVEVNVRNYRRFQALLLCLGFTGGDVAWADPADEVVPPAPRETTGSTARVGTAVGFLYGTPDHVLALGLMAAAGQRFGRLGIEAEYSYLSFQTHEVYMTEFGPTDGNITVGKGQRLAA